MSVTPPEPPAEPPQGQGSIWTKVAVGAAVAALAVVLFVVLRPDDDEGAEPTPAAETTTEDTTEEATTEETTTEEQTTEEATTEETTTEEEPEVQRVVVEVDENAQPVGGVVHAEIERGSRVLLLVRADVSDHVHLHGYDLIADVAPGQPARIRFQAQDAGVFEAELEDRAVPIAELEVQ
jgi:hypothetical protein